LPCFVFHAYEFIWIGNGQLQAQPSPTTGTLPFSMATNDKSTLPPAAKITEDFTFDNDVFSFQPHLGSKQQSFTTAEKVIFLTVSIYQYFPLRYYYNTILLPLLPISPLNSLFGF
jgi:hypothetical protein